jgi:hypothetical protein
VEEGEDFESLLLGASGLLDLEDLHQFDEVLLLQEVA